MATIFGPLYETVTLLAERLNGNLEILAFAGLVLALYQLLDYKLFRYKPNRV
jgi:hypothetical protein